MNNFSFVLLFGTPMIKITQIEKMNSNILQLLSSSSCITLKAYKLKQPALAKFTHLCVNLVNQKIEIHNKDKLLEYNAKYILLACCCKLITLLLLLSFTNIDSISKRRNKFSFGTKKNKNKTGQEFSSLKPFFICLSLA